MDHKKVKFALGSLLIVGAIGYLIATGINRTSTYLRFFRNYKRKQK